jgi:hypothetical protein
MTTEEKAENPLDDGDEEVISVVPRPCRTSTTSIFGSDIGGLVHDVIERYLENLEKSGSVGRPRDPDFSRFCKKTPPGKSGFAEK